jgi:hypothetical protein
VSQADGPQPAALPDAQSKSDISEEKENEQKASCNPDCGSFVRGIVCILPATHALAASVW